ncbi:MAG: hypothetical protein K2P14_03560 [Anaeroplasmataceae bacterium]|nr:hypothetical protein [Anaeroplasmataceae bacterium]
MELDVNINELEQQRYNAIKETNEYIEINILIGKEKEKLDNDRIGRMPVITTTMHGCGAEEVACMYSTLTALVEYFEKQYPAECCFAELCMYSNDMGSIEIPKNQNNEEE